MFSIKRQGLLAAIICLAGALQVCHADDPYFCNPADCFPASVIPASFSIDVPREEQLVRLPPLLPVLEEGTFYDPIVPVENEMPLETIPFDLLQRNQRRGIFSGVSNYFGILLSDQTNYYSRDNLTMLGAGVLAAAPLANTPADREFRDWYQRQLRTDGSDDFSKTAKLFGEQWVVIPAYFAAAGIGKLTESLPAGEALNEWGDRSIRSMLVGICPMLFMQFALGASRPDENSSYWQPFNDINAVSGHSFVGAIPFMNAAVMAEERPLLQTSFYVLSTMPAWSRINDDAHYLSQSILGWWMAYLSVQCVNRTNLELSHFSITPAYTPGGAGVVLDYRY